MKKVSLDQFAAMNMVYNRYSFTYFLDSIERMGIRCFELWTGAPHLCNFIESLADAKKVKQEVARRNMKIICVTPEQVMYPHNIAASNEELRRWSLDYFLSYVDMTAELGVDKMLCCSGWGDYDQNKEDAWKREVDGLHEMAQHAAKAGVTLAFEVLSPYETNLVNDFESTKRIMEEVNLPSFQLCVDTVPIRIAGDSLEQFFQELGERICHVHLTDGTPGGHMPCGSGDHPIGEYLKVIGKYDYDGYITLEIGDTFWSTDPEKATRMALDTIKSLIK